ncbi:MAG: hydrogenase maturation protease [Calditrichaeota bacterium]|nr:hydrogenase maturation protease [Calditrichota bacterium]
MAQKKTLVLGIGNILMGDEGIGVHAVQYLERHHARPDVDYLDGGTGGFHLMEYFQSYDHVILIDATLDNQPAGTIQVLHPRFSSDYPPTLTAHDIGLKDMLDAIHLLQQQPRITLVAISIPSLGALSTELSPELQQKLPEIADTVLRIVSESSG